MKSGKMEQTFMFSMCSARACFTWFCCPKSHFQYAVKTVLRKGKLASPTRHLLYGEDCYGSKNLFIKISEYV